MELSKEYDLINVTLIDGNGGMPESDMFVSVKDGLITTVDSMKNYNKSVNQKQQLDFGGEYLMPGMIDAHVHLAGGRGDYVYGETEVLAEPKTVRSMRSVYEAQKILKRGFTSVRDISWNGLYLKRIFGEGILPGPRIIACGPGLGRTGGHVDLFQYPLEFVKKEHFWGVLADGEEEIRKCTRRILREGADQIKFWASGGDNWANDRNSDVHYTFNEMKIIIEEAKMIKGTFVCCHAENKEAIEMAVDAGVNTIEHGEDLDTILAKKMAEKGVILVPTLGILINWFDEIMATGDEATLIRPEIFLHRTVDDICDNSYQNKIVSNVKKSFAIARENGVKIALGSDTVYEPLTEYGEYSAREFKTLVKCGMTVSEAIMSATKIGAEALGLLHRIGTIEVGKNADMLVVKRNPTDSEEVLYDAKNIRLIICKGRLAVEDGRLAF